MAGGGGFGWRGGHVRGARRVLGGKAVHNATPVHTVSYIVLDIDTGLCKQLEIVSIFLFSRDLQRLQLNDSCNSPV